MIYSYPIPLAFFRKLSREGQTSLEFVERTKRTALPAPWIPDDLQGAFAVGDIIECIVPVPPGAATVGWNAQFDSRTCFFSANAGNWESWEPPLFPQGYNPNIHPKPTAPNLQAHYAVGRIKLNRVEQMLEFSVTFTLTDGKLYNDWVAAGCPMTTIETPKPETHEARTQRLIEEAELIRPLMLLANETDPTRFVVRAKESGTWEGMLRLIRWARD